MVSSALHQLWLSVLHLTTSLEDTVRNVSTIDLYCCIAKNDNLRTENDGPSQGP